MFAAHHEKKLCSCVSYKVSIDHLFDNLESGKEIIVFEKGLEKVLNFRSKSLYEPSLNAFLLLGAVILKKCRNNHVRNFMWFFFTAAYIERFSHAVLTYNTNFQVILAGAVKIADAVDRCRTSVVVHCSDGWDRTSQVSIHASILYSDLYEIATSSLVLLCVS